MDSKIYDSILNTIKKLIGTDIDYGVFDIDLVVAINSAFMILNQLGIGPDKPYNITGPDETWKDFFGDEEVFALAKSYIYLRTKLLFDPPTSGVLHEAVERQISEFEWRMHIQADYNDAVKDEPIPDNPETPSEGGGTLDHSQLINRDRPDQHPIGAITGLEGELDTIPRAMTKDELLDILNDEGGDKLGLARDLFKSRRSKDSLGESQS